MSGRNWTRIEPVPALAWVSVCFGNNEFVAVDSRSNNPSKYMVSPDGLMWTERLTGTSSEPWTSMCFGNGVLVAVSSNGRVMYKNNTDTVWTINTNPLNTNPNSLRLTDVCFGNNKFVAVSSNILSPPQTIYSSDGITWTNGFTGLPIYTWTSVCNGAERFVAVGHSNTPQRFQSMYSDDGIHWTVNPPQELGEAGIPLKVCFGNISDEENLFVVVGTFILTSPDGVTWTRRASPYTTAPLRMMYSVCFGEGTFVAVGNSQVMTSSDGVNWTKRIAAINIPWRCVTYETAIFVAVGISRVMISGELVCVIGSTQITLSDGSTKQIKDLQRGDEILQDADTQSTAIVSRVISTNAREPELVRMPPGLLGNTQELILTGSHPIHAKDGKTRLQAKNVPGTQPVRVENEAVILFNLQFDTEGTFYANQVKVDSMSPYFHRYVLPETLFIDKTKHIQNKRIWEENDESRGKPLLIDNCDSIADFFPPCPDNPSSDI